MLQTCTHGVNISQKPRRAPATEFRSAPTATGSATELNKYIFHSRRPPSHLSTSARRKPIQHMSALPWTIAQAVKKENISPIHQLRKWSVAANWQQTSVSVCPQTLCPSMALAARANNKLINRIAFSELQQQSLQVSMKYNLTAPAVSAATHALLP